MTQTLQKKIEEIIENKFYGEGGVTLSSYEVRAASDAILSAFRACVPEKAITRSFLPTEINKWFVEGLNACVKAILKKLQ